MGPPGLELDQQVSGQQRFLRPQCRSYQDGRGGEQREKDYEPPRFW